MKQEKLNNKGITLVELIVSFVIVAVAVVYFYQMLISVTKMYANAKEENEHAAKVNYAFRLLDEAYETEEIDTCSITEEGEILGEIIGEDCDEKTISQYFDKVTFSIDDKKYSLYKYRID